MQDIQWPTCYCKLVGCLQCQDSMTIIEVKLEWYIEVLTGSVVMQVSLKTTSYFRVQAVFQDPYCSLHKRSSICHIAFLFADDTKCYMRIKTTEDILHLQENIRFHILVEYILKGGLHESFLCLFFTLIYSVCYVFNVCNICFWK